MISVVFSATAANASAGPGDILKGELDSIKINVQWKDGGYYIMVAYSEGLSAYLILINKEGKKTYFEMKYDDGYYSTWISEDDAKGRSTIYAVFIDSDGKLNQDEDGTVEALDLAVFELHIKGKKNRVRLTAETVIRTRLLIDIEVIGTGKIVSDDILNRKGTDEQTNVFVNGITRSSSRTGIGPNSFQVNTYTLELSTTDPDFAIDSFFDVFYEIDLHPPDPVKGSNADSFFDISYTLKSERMHIDSFFDVTYKHNNKGNNFFVDSFFDVFYELDLPDLKDSLFDVFTDVDFGLPYPGRVRGGFTSDSFFDIDWKIEYDGSVRVPGRDVAANGQFASSLVGNPRDITDMTKHVSLGTGSHGAKITGIPLRPFSMFSHTEGVNTKTDSFFDVFTEMNFGAVAPARPVSSPGTDSFFDVFTELSFMLPRPVLSPDTGAVSVESFFDSFNKVAVNDQDWDLVAVDNNDYDLVAINNNEYDRVALKNDINTDEDCDDCDDSRFDVIHKSSFDLEAYTDYEWLRNSQVGDLLDYNVDSNNHLDCEMYMSDPDNDNYIPDKFGADVSTKSNGAVYIFHGEDGVWGNIRVNDYQEGGVNEKTHNILGPDYKINTEMERDVSGTVYLVISVDGEDLTPHPVESVPVTKLADEAIRGGDLEVNWIYDSFFDVFFDVEVEMPVEPTGTIQTEIVSMNLKGDSDLDVTGEGSATDLIIEINESIRSLSPTKDGLVFDSFFDVFYDNSGHIMGYGESPFHADSFFDVYYDVDTSDSTDERNVKKTTSKIHKLAHIESENHSPPKCIVSWGQGLKLKGFQSSLSEKYTKFLPDGTPLRSTVNLGITEQIASEEQLHEVSFYSESTHSDKADDKNKVHVVNSDIKATTNFKLDSENSDLLSGMGTMKLDGETKGQYDSDLIDFDFEVKVKPTCEIKLGEQNWITLTSGKASAKISSNRLKELSGNLEFDAEMNIGSSDGESVKIKGQVEGKYEAGGKVDIDGTIKVKEDFVYEKGKIKATLNSGSIKVDVKSSKFERSSFSGLVIDVDVKIPKGTGLKLNGELDGKYETEKEDLDKGTDGKFFVDSFFDVFVELDLPEINETVPIEMVALSLTSNTGVGTTLRDPTGGDPGKERFDIDSFFDVFVELNLPGIDSGDTAESYLLSIQTQMGLQQSTFTNISNALNVKYSMERSAIQNFRCSTSNSDSNENNAEEVMGVDPQPFRLDMFQEVVIDTSGHELGVGQSPFIVDSFFDVLMETPTAFTTGEGEVAYQQIYNYVSAGAESKPSSTQGYEKGKLKIGVNLGAALGLGSGGGIGSNATRSSQKNNAVSDPGAEVGGVEPSPFRMAISSESSINTGTSSDNQTPIVSLSNQEIIYFDYGYNDTTQLNYSSVIFTTGTVKESWYDKNGEVDKEQVDGAEQVAPQPYGTAILEFDNKILIGDENGTGAQFFILSNSSIQMELGNVVSTDDDEKDNMSSSRAAGSSPEPGSDVMGVDPTPFIDSFFEVFVEVDLPGLSTDIITRTHITTPGQKNGSNASNPIMDTPAPVKGTSSKFESRQSCIMNSNKYHMDSFFEASTSLWGYQPCQDAGWSMRVSSYNEFISDFVGDPDNDDNNSDDDNSTDECPYCGAEIDPADGRCPECGSDLQDNDSGDPNDSTLQLNRTRLNKADFSSSVDVMFNPEKITIKKAVNWNAQRKDYPGARDDLPKTRNTTGTMNSLSKGTDESSNNQRTTGGTSTGNITAGQGYGLMTDFFAGEVLVVDFALQQTTPTHPVGNLPMKVKVTSTSRTNFGNVYAPSIISTTVVNTNVSSVTDGFMDVDIGLSTISLMGNTNINESILAKLMAFAERNAEELDDAGFDDEEILGTAASGPDGLGSGGRKTGNNTRSSYVVNTFSGTISVIDNPQTGTPGAIVSIGTQIANIGPNTIDPWSDRPENETPSDDSDQNNGDDNLMVFGVSATAEWGGSAGAVDVTDLFSSKVSISSSTILGISKAPNFDPINRSDADETDENLSERPSRGYSIFSKQVVGMEASFGEPGSETLIIAGFDVYHRLTRGTNSRTWGDGTRDDTGEDSGTFIVDSFFDVDVDMETEQGGEKNNSRPTVTSFEINHRLITRNDSNGYVDRTDITGSVAIRIGDPDPDRPQGSEGDDAFGTGRFLMKINFSMLSSGEREGTVVVSGQSTPGVKFEIEIEREIRIMKHNDSSNDHDSVDNLSPIEKYDVVFTSGQERDVHETDHWSAVERRKDITLNINIRDSDGGFFDEINVFLLTDETEYKVQVKLPWLPDSNDTGDVDDFQTTWSRITVIMAGNNRGNWTLPEVDDEVEVAIESSRSIDFNITVGTWTLEDNKYTWKGMILKGKYNASNKTGIWGSYLGSAVWYPENKTGIWTGHLGTGVWADNGSTNVWGARLGSGIWGQGSESSIWGNRMSSGVWAESFGSGIWRSVPDGGIWGSYSGGGIWGSSSGGGVWGNQDSSGI